MRNPFADGTSPSTVPVLPGQAILLAWSGDHTLSVLVHVIPIALLKSVIVLRFHVPVTDLNGIQLIGTNAAIQKFLPPGWRIKEPFVTLFHERYGEWPILIADKKERANPRLGIDGNAQFLVGL